MSTHTYETTYETTGENDAVMGSVELRIEYEFTPGTGDYYDASIGGMGGWTPGDSPEVSIIAIKQEFFVTGADGSYWAETDMQTFWDFVENECMDAMEEHACEELADRAMVAAEAKGDAMREERD